jgi:hypothetical protein
VDDCEQEIRPCKSLTGLMVSRVGIEPTTRRLRGSRELKSIAADPEKSRQIGAGRFHPRLLVVGSGRVVRNLLHILARAGRTGRTESSEAAEAA